LCAKGKTEVQNSHITTYMIAWKNTEKDDHLLKGKRRGGGRGREFDFQLMIQPLEKEELDEQTLTWVPDGKEEGIGS